MSEKKSELGGGWWSKNLDDVDREVARLATICKVRLLDPGVIQRVLDNDATVCGTSNPAAFDKLRQALMMHYHVRDKAVGAIGEAATAGRHQRNRRQHPQAARQAARGIAPSTGVLAVPAVLASHTRSPMNTEAKLAQSQDIATKVSVLFRKRAEHARDEFAQRLAKAAGDNGMRDPGVGARMWTDWYGYAVDATQRSILFWDTIRQRGNKFVEHNQAGLPPVLHFEYETVVDGRKLARPVNYALVRIVPPEGVTVDPKRRPYVIIDPRAGHGPGIGGFKDDSQVGVALREGHPVYFVIFFRDPEPGQTLIDVCKAEKAFVRKVRELHPQSAKPAIVGNCQGGWAAMMLAASDPDDTGPIVINGAPMSYWGGAWQEGENDNPMRYAGGMLGGTWLSSLASDLGDGVFDGAYLVENFENLNPANTFWDKYYHLYANVDTEPPRFLEFERWWGGFYLMNREEIEWITRNLFVGNKVWKGTTRRPGRHGVRPAQHQGRRSCCSRRWATTSRRRSRRSTGSPTSTGRTDEIKARGQVIVGLMHENVGHLGIFVSGKVAKKEHAQIVSVLKSIESLPPGLYAMRIEERKARGGETSYDVSFEERRLEDIAAKLNRFERATTRSRSRRSRRSPTSTSARTSSSCSRSCRRSTGRVRGEAAPPVPSAAPAALGAVRLQPVSRVARTRSGDGEGQARAGDGGQQPRQGGEDRVVGDQRLARLLPRACATP